MQPSLLVLAVVLAHADVVQAVLPPPNSTSTTPPQTNPSTKPPPSTPQPILLAQSCTAYTDASCPSGDRVKRGKDWNRGSQDVFTQGEGVKLWQFTTQGSVHSSPTLSPDGESIFVGSFDKRLYSINAGSGALRWSFSTSGVVFSKPAVSPDGATVFVGSGDYNLYALNAASGAKRWSFTTRDLVYSSPVLSPDGATVFVGSTDYNLYAINAVSGDKRWSFDTGGYVQSSPALSPDGSTVFVVSADFNMYAISAASGAKRWSFSVGALEGPWFYTRNIYQLPSPALSPDGATVFVGSLGSHDRGLHAINAVSGAKRWSFTTGSPPVTSTPAISPDGAIVYFGTHYSKLHALDATSGANLWSFTTQGAVRSSPALSPDGATVFVGSDDTKLYAVDATSGVQRWSFTLGSAVGFCSSPTLSPDYSTIFVGSQGQEAAPPGKDGKLFAIVAPSPDNYGTITGVGAKGIRWCKVKWDNGLSDSYRVGWDGAHDLCLVSSSHKTSQLDPARPSSDNLRSETVSTAWFHGPALSSRILLITLGVSGFVLVAGLVAMCCFRNRKRKIVFRMKTVLFLIFFLLDFAWMGARFNWLLNSEDAKFQTMMTPETGEYIWISPKFADSSLSQRQQLGCNFSLSELKEAPKDACKVWWVVFSADISFQGSSWDAGAAKFSVGFGLVIFAVLEIAVFFFVLGTELKDMEEEEESISSPAGGLSTCTRALASVC
jgi:outer membrane protein assembly factor BamB